MSVQPQKASFLRQSFNYISTTFFSNLLTIITLPIFTRYLNPSDYGVISLFVMFGMATSSLLSLGIQAATFRYYFDKRNQPDEFKRLNFTNLAFNTCVFLGATPAIWLLKDLVSDWIFDNNISGQLLMLSFFSGCFEYFNTYLFFLLTARGQSRAFGIVTLGKMLVNIGLSFYFIIFHSMTHMGRIHGLWVSQLLTILILFYLNRDTILPVFSATLLKKSIKFSAPQLPLSLLGMIYTSLDKTMLSSYRGLTAVGQYNFGERFASLVSLCMDSVDRAWAPFFLSKANEGTEFAKKQIVARFTELSFVFMIGGMCVIYFSEELIRILTTKEFYPAMYVVPIYAYYYIFGMTGKIAVNQLMFAEKLSYLAPSSIISVVLNILLNIILIKKFGAIGAAIATAVASCGASIVLVYFGNRAYPLPISPAKLVGIFVIFMLFTALVYPIMASEMHFALKLLLKTAIITLYIFMGIKFKYIEVHQIKNYLQRFPLPSLKQQPKTVS